MEWRRAFAAAATAETLYFPIGADGYLNMNRAAAC
jgi:hypothetical protein